MDITTSDWMILGLWGVLGSYFLLLYIRSSVRAGSLTRNVRAFLHLSTHRKFVAGGLSFAFKVWPITIAGIVVSLASAYVTFAHGAMDSLSAMLEELRWVWILPGVALLPLAAYCLKLFAFPQSEATRPVLRWLAGSFFFYCVASVVLAAVLVAPDIRGLTLESKVREVVDASISEAPQRTSVVYAALSRLLICADISELSRFLAILLGIFLVAAWPWFLAIPEATGTRLSLRRRRFYRGLVGMTVAVCAVSMFAGFLVSARNGGSGPVFWGAFYVFWVASAAFSASFTAAYVIALAFGRRGAALHKSVLSGLPAVFTFVLIFHIARDLEYWIVLTTVAQLNEGYAHVALTTGSVWRMLRLAGFLLLAYTPFLGIEEGKRFLPAANQSLGMWGRQVGLSLAVFLGVTVTMSLASYVLSPREDIVGFEHAIVFVISLVFVGGLAGLLTDIRGAVGQASRSEATEAYS
jgi:hypothetical protein